MVRRFLCLGASSHHLSSFDRGPALGFHVWVGMVDKLIGGGPGFFLGIPHHQVGAQTEHRRALRFFILFTQSIQASFGVFQRLYPAQVHVRLSA